MSARRSQLYVTKNLEVLNAKALNGEAALIEHVGSIGGNQRLRLHNPRIHDQLRATLARVETRAGYGILALNIGKQSRGRYLLVSQLHVPIGRSEGYESVFELTLVDLSKALSISPQILKRDFGITSTEARLCLGLVNELSLPEFAKEAGLSVGTARWHWTNVRRKLGVHSQTSLVRLILHLYGR